MWDTLEQDGIAQTGSYKTEEDSYKPLVIDSPTGGGKIGLVAGTVSLNAQTPDYDWRVDRLRESGDPNHQADIDKAVAKAKAAREQGADVVAMAMHSVQEYLDYADSWQQEEAHELADTGAFDVIYGAGCHCAQPIENYNGTWIIYGLGNAVTESANTADTIVNNQGVTARIQFAGKKVWRARGASTVSTGCPAPMRRKANTNGVRWQATIRTAPVGMKRKTRMCANASGTCSTPWAPTKTWSRNGI